MTQTLAIFLDAYRELNARKLFWITLVLSGFVVGVYGMIGLNEDGVQVLFWTMPLGPDSNMMSPDVFYKMIFADLGIGMWLSLAATILALVTTAGIIPDLVASGPIDLMLSKPISRVRLFLTKYATGLLFVTLQVTVFCVGAFLVMGLRGGTWEPALFVAVPLVVCFYSYLFAICALAGLLTKSTIAALMLTLLAWVLIFAVNLTDVVFGMLKIAKEQRVVLIERDIEKRKELLQVRRQEPPPAEDRGRREVRIRNMTSALEQRLAELEEAEAEASGWRTIHGGVIALKTLLPKTGETIALLERVLIETADLPEPLPPKRPPMISLNSDVVTEIDVSFFDPNVAMEVALEGRERSVGWIVGTSLGFEAVLLAIACVIFIRRDF